MMTPKIKNLLYGWRARDDGLETFVVGSWYRNERPGGTAVRVHLVPPKKLLREDGLVFNQYEALVFTHDKVMVPLDGLGGWTDTIFDDNRVIVSFMLTGIRIAHLEEAAKALNVRPWKIAEVEVIRNGARARFEQLISSIEGWDDPRLEAPDRAVVRALKKRRSPGDFAKRAGLDKPKLEVGKVMEGLAWLDKELAKIPVPNLALYLNVHPFQRYVNFEIINPATGGGYWLNERVNVKVAEHFKFDLDEARRIPNVLYKAKILSAPDLPRIEITEEH